MPAVAAVAAAVITAIAMVYAAWISSSPPPATNTANPESNQVSSPTAKSSSELPLRRPLSDLAIGRFLPCFDAKSQLVREESPDPLPSPQGFDLDCGTSTSDEGVPGADISGRRNGGVIDTLSQYARLAWVDEVKLQDFATCTGLETSWQRSLDGLDQPTAVDRSICVRTSEGNVAIITLDEPSVAGSDLEFTYRIRYFR
jgi:hypothetical protein